MAEKLRILIAAGGTGGHLFPAMAVAEEINRLSNNDVEFVFVGNPDKLEARIVPEAGYEFVPMPISGYSGMKSLKALLMPCKILKSISLCKRLIKNRGFDAVIATGAYISYPPGVAASAMKVPLFLMESNVNPGKSIKMLARKAKLILTSFEDSVKYFETKFHSKIRCVGNPVRMQITEKTDKSDAREFFGLQPDKQTILIFGGSLGARTINNTIEKHLSRLSEMNCQFIWQTGTSYQISSSVPPNVKVVPFISEMGKAYAASDIVISRSGATSVAEICISGKPSILVPYPSASNNEQENNALVLENQQAAIVIKDSEFSEIFFDRLVTLKANPEQLALMSSNAHKLAKANAAKSAAKMIIDSILLKTS